MLIYSKYKQLNKLRYLTCFVCTHNRFDITNKKTQASHENIANEKKNLQKV